MISLISPRHLVKGPRIPGNLPARLYVASDGCPLILLYLDANCNGWCNSSDLRFTICSVHRHPNPQHKHQLLEEQSHRWKAHPIPLPEQRSPSLPILSPASPLFAFHSLSYRETVRSTNLPSRPLLIPIARVEPRGVWGRRWPHRRREAERTAATLDELLIWTNREAVGGVHGQQQAQRWRAPQVFCYKLFTAASCYLYRPWRFLYASDWPAKAVFFLSKTPTRWTLIKVSALSPLLVFPLTHRRYQHR